MKFQDLPEHVQKAWQNMVQAKNDYLLVLVASADDRKLLDAVGESARLLAVAERMVINEMVIALVDAPVSRSVREIEDEYRLNAALAAPQMVI